jgi:hypothetical protein
MSLKNDEIKYNDVRLFLWLIPCINILNYYLTYTTYGPAWRVIATFTIDTIQGYIAWLILRSIVLWLDKKIPYQKNLQKRLFSQIVLTVLGGTASIIILTECVNWLATSKPVPRSFYQKDIFIISIWFFVVNGIYIGLYYYHKLQESEQKWKKNFINKPTGFKVSIGKKDLILSFEEIIGFYVEGEYSVVVTAEGKKFLNNSSLDKIEKLLPSSNFIRLNRQYIVHRQVISGFEKSENGKINVLLKNTYHLSQAIPVSRNRAPVFKSWFSPSQLVISGE